MEHTMIFLITTAALMLVTAVGFSYVRGQFNKKRNSYRMGQALRRGLAVADGSWTPTPRVVEWQACETSTANW